jgi:hypothetical protein
MHSAWKMIESLRKEIIDSDIEFVCKAFNSADSDERAASLSGRIEGYFSLAGEISWSAWIEVQEDSEVNYPLQAKGRDDAFMMCEEGNSPSEAVLNLLARWEKIKEIVTQEVIREMYGE